MMQVERHEIDGTAATLAGDAAALDAKMDQVINRLRNSLILVSLMYRTRL